MFDATVPYEVLDMRSVAEQRRLSAVAVLHTVPGAIAAYALDDRHETFSLEPETNLEVEEGGVVTLYDDSGMVVFSPLGPESELLELLDLTFEELFGGCFT